MGVLKFRFDPADLASRIPEVRSAYFTGLDRTPARTSIEVRPGMLVCSREGPESGRLHTSWPVEGCGAPVLSTATLAERAEPFELAVELARGRLNDVRNQAADWTGLDLPPDFGPLMADALRTFARAATQRGDPATAAELAQESLGASLRAADLLVDAYANHVLVRRQEFTPKLPTALSCPLEGDPRRSPGLAAVQPAINTARLTCPWSRLAPTEGRFRWDDFDAQIAWCRAHRIPPAVGPLVELRPGALPDWLWLWGGDFDQVLALVEDLIRQTVGRYKGKVATWHLVHRAGSGEVLGLSEEEQVRLTARALQIARRIDPEAQLVIDFDQPWSDWMATSRFDLGPLQLADSLARAELGLTGIGLELAPGYSSPGSSYRDLLDVSRLLDLFALISLPLHVGLVLPSGSTPDPAADPAVSVIVPQWPQPPSEALQRDLAARWIALITAKPYVRAVHWLQTADAHPHLYPHGGLLRKDHSPKPLVDWLRNFRATYLD